MGGVADLVACSFVQDASSHNKAWSRTSSGVALLKSS
mgnify:CR=1 FL=1